MTRSLTYELLAWYAVHGRDMPWRVKGGAHSDPYAVWISEIMLQQTTVKTVVAYFKRWMKRFPTLKSLARADIHDVLLMWQGLGYYTRAKKLHECAQVLTSRYNGVFPHSRDELLKLPGIGPYTASSICCFAFNQPETVVDGNVIRVLARVYGLTHAVTKEEIYALAQKLTPKDHGADYASAIMDLGATICTPSSPLCPQCPWQKSCVAYRKGLTEQIPLIQKPAKKERRGTVYVIQNKAGAYYIRKRAGKGLLSGLYEFPWVYDGEPPLFPGRAIGQVAHVFTHFKLTLNVVRVRRDDADLGGDFVAVKDFKKYPFPTLMNRVMKMIE